MTYGTGPDDYGATPPPPGRRRSAIWVIVGLLGVLVLVLIGVFACTPAPATTGYTGPPTSAVPPPVTYTSAPPPVTYTSTLPPATYPTPPPVTYSTTPTVPTGVDAGSGGAAGDGGWPVGPLLGVTGLVLASFAAVALLRGRRAG
jgi:hypothetical protein